MKEKSPQIFFALLGLQQQYHCRWPWTCLIFQCVSDFNYFLPLYVTCSGLLYTHSLVRDTLLERDEGIWVY